MCCCFCCLQKMEVFSPPGKLVGTVEQDWVFSLTSVWFSVKDEHGNTVLKLRGPLGENWGDIRFDVLTPDGQKVGVIDRRWSHPAWGNPYEPYDFTVTFPTDMGTEVKATLLGASLLVDVMFPQADSRAMTYLKMMVVTS